MALHSAVPIPIHIPNPDPSPNPNPNPNQSTVYFASADMDNFKLINDGWSYDHGDFAIIMTGLVIGEAVVAWNQRHQGVARCTAFRMGGDEVRVAPYRFRQRARAACALR